MSARLAEAKGPANAGQADAEAFRIDSLDELLVNLIIRPFVTTS